MHRTPKRCPRSRSTSRASTGCSICSMPTAPISVGRAPSARCGRKDGTVRHLFSGLNPEGTSVACFKEPTAAGARARLLVAHPQVRAGERRDRDLQPLALRGRPGRAGPRVRAAWRSGRCATISSTTSRRCSSKAGPRSSNSTCTSARKNNSNASSSASTTRSGTGRSASPTTPNARSGRSTSLPIKTRSTRRAPSTRRGSSFRRTTSGSATSRCRRSSPTRLEGMGLTLPAARVDLAQIRRYYHAAAHDQEQRSA